jgi:hypothetical protein
MICETSLLLQAIAIWRSCTLRWSRGREEKSSEEGRGEERTQEIVRGGSGKERERGRGDKGRQRDRPLPGNNAGLYDVFKFQDASAQHSTAPCGESREEKSRAHSIGSRDGVEEHSALWVLWQSRQGMRGGETGSAEGGGGGRDLEAIAIAKLLTRREVKVEPSGEISSGGTRPPDRMVLKRDLREEMGS